MKTISMTMQEYQNDISNAKEAAQNELYERITSHFLGIEPGFKGFSIEPHRLDTFDKVIRHLRGGGSNV